MRPPVTPSATDPKAAAADEEELSAEKLRAMARFKELIAALGTTQEAFADATDGHLTRVEVNGAANGRNLYKTEQWLAGISAAIGGARFEDIVEWRNDRITSEELVRRTRNVGPSRPHLDALLAKRPHAYTHGDIADARRQQFARRDDPSEEEWDGILASIRARRVGKSADVSGGDTDDASHPSHTQNPLKHRGKRP